MSHVTWMHMCVDYWTVVCAARVAPRRNTKPTHPMSPWIGSNSGRWLSSHSSLDGNQQKYIGPSLKPCLIATLKIKWWPLYLIWLREKTSFTAKTFQCEGCSRLSSTFFKKFSFATSFPMRLLIFDVNTWAMALWNDISAINRRCNVLNFMSNLTFCITVGSSSCMVHILSCRLMFYDAMTPSVLPFTFHFNDDFESKFTEFLKKWACFLSTFVLIFTLAFMYKTQNDFAQDCFASWFKVTLGMLHNLSNGYWILPRHILKNLPQVLVFLTVTSGTVYHFQ